MPVFTSPFFNAEIHQPLFIHICVEVPIHLHAYKTVRPDACVPMAALKMKLYPYSQCRHEQYG
jgi:hypothetical protein